MVKLKVSDLSGFRNSYIHHSLNKHNKTIVLTNKDKASVKDIMESIRKLRGMAESKPRHPTRTALEYDYKTLRFPAK